MKKKLLFITAFVFFSITTYGQFNTPADGHKLKWVKDFIYVYRGDANGVVLDHPKMWKHKY